MGPIEASEPYIGFLRYTLTCNVAGVDTSQQRVGRGLQIVGAVAPKLFIETVRS